MIIQRMTNLLNRKTFHRSKCAWFHTSDDQNWLLSNMAGGMVVKFAGTRWNSSEALYQASKYSSNVICIPESSKAKKNVEPCIRNRIRTSTNARGAKMTQKCAVKAGLVREDWADPAKEIRIDAMCWVLEQKLICNKIFKNALLATEDLPIVEVSKKDAFWGCIPDGDLLVGQNVLGELLTDLRSRIDDVSSGKQSFPLGFLLP